MGFGLLFIGYFFMLSLPVGGIDLLPDFIGCLIMLAGLKTLVSHCPGNRGFQYAGFTLYPLTVLSIAILGCQLAASSGMLSDSLRAYLYVPLTVVYTIAVGVFHALLFSGIYVLSREVGLPKLSNRARRMLVLTALYYICELLAALGITNLIADGAQSPDVVLSYINLVIYVMGSLWLILSWALILTCYMRICLEGDEDMPYRDNVHDRIVSCLKKKKKK